MFLRPAKKTKEEEGKRREKRKGYRSCLAKSVLHRKQGSENRQTDPLDGRIPGRGWTSSRVRGQLKRLANPESEQTRV